MVDIILIVIFVVNTTIMEYPPITVKTQDYHKAMLMILNFTLNLSNMEMDMLSIWLNHGITVVDTNARDLVRKILDKDKFITNNYIKRLKNKGILIIKPADKQLYINTGILDVMKDKKVSFEFRVHE